MWSCASVCPSVVILQNFFISVWCGNDACLFEILILSVITDISILGTQMSIIKIPAGSRHMLVFPDVNEGGTCHILSDLDGLMLLSSTATEL